MSEAGPGLTSDATQSQTGRGNADSNGAELASVNGTPTASGVGLGYPGGFMTPIQTSQGLYPQSTSNIRRPSSDINRPYPPTPTRSFPANTPRSRSKGWAAAAAKSVDALRGSTKLTNYSKRTPYKSRSQGFGKTVCITVVQ